MNESAKNFLPEVLKNIDGNITSANLKTQRTSDGRYRFLPFFLTLISRYLHTYTVSWSGQRFSDSKTSKEPPVSIGFWDFLKKWMPTSSVPSAPAIQPSDTFTMIRCDGPCDKMVPYRSTRILGLCEHVICQTCMKKADVIPLAGRMAFGGVGLVLDGGSGCPNRECYSDDLGGLNRAGSRSKSKSSNKGKQWKSC